MTLVPGCMEHGVEVQVTHLLSEAAPSANAVDDFRGGVQVSVIRPSQSFLGSRCGSP